MTARRPTRRGAVVAAVMALGVAVLAPGCARLGLGGDKPGYKVTAYFPEAVALYPHSKVKVMGVDAGTVQKVKIDHSRVRVDMLIDKDVPLPTDVNVTIQALSIIGERNVVMSPAWKPGKPRIQDHLSGDHEFVIPADHTSTPVEPDDALKAFSDLASAVDPNAVTALIHSSANAFDGHGKTFNDLLGSASSLSEQLASQDQEILQTAKNLHTLAGSVNTRSQQLGEVIDGFSQATGTLAQQREAITTLLQGANNLVGSGQSLLDRYQGQLPGDLAKLARLGLTLQSSSDTFKALITDVPKIAKGLINAYDPATKQLRLGIDINDALSGALGPSAQILLKSPLIQQALGGTGVIPALCNSNPQVGQLLACPNA